MKGEFVVAFTRGPFFWLDADSKDLVQSYSRLDKVPAVDEDGDSIPTCRVIIEADPAIIDQIANDPDTLYLGEIVEAR